MLTDMARVAKMKPAIVLLILLIVFFLEVNSFRGVIDIDRDNIEDTLKERKAVMLYITDEMCVKCKRLFHKFVTTSQTFLHDEVIFGHVQDDKIAERYEVTSFPGIVFYEFGSSIPRAYRGGIASSELSKLIIKALRGDFRSLDLKHAVELTKTNFDTIMDVTNQCKLVMLHERDDEDEIDDYEELAETFENEEGLVIARIDVDKQKKLKKLFNTLDYPTYYFFPKGSNDRRKLDGGQLKIDEMVSFINKECGTHRMKGGRLNPYAGLIPEIDGLLDGHGKDLYEVKNLKRLSKKIKNMVDKLPDDADKDMATFYVDLIDVLNEEGSIEALDGVKNRIFSEMDSAGPFKMDQLFRQRNIVDKIVDIIGKHLLTDLSKMEMKFDEINNQKSGYKKMKSHDEL